MHLLSEGGFILFMCIGANTENNLRLGVQHFVRPLRQAKELKEMVPIVVMSPVVPRDWEAVCDQHDVFFFKGSPLSQSDLERVNFRKASAIFICNVANGSALTQLAEAWMVDSEAICCARLVESQLAVGVQTLVVADLKSDANHLFLPVPKTSNTGSVVAELSSQSMSQAEEDRLMAHQRSTQDFDSDSDSEYSADRLSGRASRITGRSSVTIKTGFGRSGSMTSMGSAKSAASLSSFKSMKSKASSRSKGGKDGEDLAIQKKEFDAYYQQPRFASGQLFVGAVVTSLVVNTFYNPSLSDLVGSMIASNVFTSLVPLEWVGKSYFEYFDYLLWTENRLAVGLLRRADPQQVDEEWASQAQEDSNAFVSEGSSKSKGASAKKRFAFVYTAPPAKETTMLQTDRVICFGRSAQVEAKEAEAAERAQKKAADKS